MLLPSFFDVAAVVFAAASDPVLTPYAVSVTAYDAAAVAAIA